MIVNIDEHDGHTRATARLQTRDGEGRIGIGHAQLDPAERDVPEIGDELAVARALADLAEHLLAAAAADVGENTRDGQDAGSTHRPGASREARP